jgi:hypothetical protein
MGKRMLKITKRHKIALGKLSQQFCSAAEIGVDESILDDLAAHKLARAVLDHGEMRYRITGLGKRKLNPSTPAEEGA